MNFKYFILIFTMLGGCSQIAGLDELEFAETNTDPMNKKDAGDTKVSDTDTIIIDTSTTDTSTHGDDGGVPDSGNREPACTEGLIRCEGQAQTRRSLCTDGQWKTTESCTEGDLCDNTTGKCAPIVEGCSGVEPGKFSCIGRDRITCGPDLVTRSRLTCKTVDHCIGSNNGLCLTCIDGEHRCDGDELQVCNESHTGFVAVDQCKPGECNSLIGMCTELACIPDSYACYIETNTLVLCNADGSAYNETPCGDRICDADNGQCDLCAEGTKTCIDGITQSACDATGQKFEEKKCAEITDDLRPYCVREGECVECLYPSMGCASPTVEWECQEDNTWGTPSSCVKSTCVTDGCVGECAPGEQRCAGQASDKRESCGADGFFKVDTTSTCPEGTLCDRNATVQGTCKTIADGCAGKAPGAGACQGAKRIVCGPDLVTITSETTCKDADYCAQGTGKNCATCTTGEYDCVGSKLNVCNATHTGWTLKETCANEALCAELDGRCSDQTCKPGVWYCDEDTLLECNSTGTGYGTQKDCNSGLCDNENKQCDLCQPDQATGTKCWDSYSRTLCDSQGQGTVEDPCRSGQICISNNACEPQVCTPNEWSCDKYILQHCDKIGSGYVTTETTKCNDETLCDAENAQCDICIAGQPYGTACADRTSQTLCNATGQGTESSPCPDGEICIKGNTCVECIAGTTKCNDDLSAIYKCLTTNVWSSRPSYCVDQTCVDGECQGECLYGTYRCYKSVVDLVSRIESQLCNKEGKWETNEICKVACQTDTTSKYYGQCVERTSGL